MSGFKRIGKYVVGALLITVLAVSILGFHMYYLGWSRVKADPGVFVGVAFCGNTTAEAKALIDRTKAYTNLFILDSGRSVLSRNQSAVYEACDYAVANGLSIIVNLGIYDVIEKNESTWFWLEPLDSIKQNWTQRWGDKFLGMYYNDEPGGIQLDGYWADWYRAYGENLSGHDHPALQALYEIYLKMLDFVYNGTEPENYDLEAEFFINEVLSDGDPGLSTLNAVGITTFTSDYGLYWWDYLGGYDVLFAELGWNASVAQQIAQVKGAARLQDKEWGAMITWKYDEVPFLDTPEKIYSQMLSAYQAGAKYITIFNYAKDDKGNTAAAMTKQHYLALERFWNDINNKQFVDKSSPEVALVLPHNYGWGMRNPNDTIWGFWSTDDKTQQIATIMSELLAKYGTSLDIVYEDSAYPVSKVEYKTVYYWNQTTT
ncbi:MAG: hypothetical protein NWE95_11380 [Candidatus Bathyarchaeota archaeon]|nr:hypothetical protein [Candidatus Bathyarchaeota archaeon]